MRLKHIPYDFFCDEIIERHRNNLLYNVNFCLSLMKKD